MIFYKLYFPKAARPMTKQYLSHMHENLVGGGEATAAGLKTGDMGSRLAFDTSQLCDNE